MMLGARTAAWAKGGYTAKDYVQDGLVAMWDGIENAGWGMHDAAATVWKDLVGSNDLQKKGTGSLVWGENCANLLKNVYFELSSFTEMYNAVIAGAFSFETVFAVDDVSNINGSIFGLGNKRTLWAYVNETVTIQTHLRQSASSIPLGENHLGEVHVLSFNGESVFIDGTKYADVASSTTSRTGNSMFSLGKLPILNDFMNGRIMCTRSYSLALSASEIATNYTVDKDRFNLP